MSRALLTALIPAILLSLISGCAPEKRAGRADPADPADPVLTAGRYAVTAADAWSGDCDLEDDATYAEPEQEWQTDPRGATLIIYPDFWDTITCDLDGMAFSCDQGSWAVEGRQTASFTRLLTGTFTDDGFTAEDSVQMDCEEPGCDLLRDLYGADSFPCAVSAPYDGERL